jgi:hypothetical protein
MGTYLLVFRSPSDRQGTADEDAAWAAWFQGLGGAVVDFGHRVVPAGSSAGVSGRCGSIGW